MVGHDMWKEPHVVRCVEKLSLEVDLTAEQQRVKERLLVLEVGVGGS
jgi:hypothetical protein